MSEGFHLEENTDMDDETFSRHRRLLDKVWFRGFWQGNVTGFLISIAIVFLVAWFANPNY